MKHKVTCMDCGKTDRIEVERGKKIHSDWRYWGKININSCQTDKFFWETKDPSKGFGDEDNWVKVPNSCYNPKIKPKYVEMWECLDCTKLVGQKK